MRVLTIHNQYQYRGGEDESSEAEDRLLRDRGHEVLRYEVSNTKIAPHNYIQVGLSTVFSPISYCDRRPCAGRSVPSSCRDTPPKKLQMSMDIFEIARSNLLNAEGRSSPSAILRGTPPL